MNIISFQRLFPIILVLYSARRSTRRSFHKLVCPFFFFFSSPLHGLIVVETCDCMTVKKKRRERERKKERIVQACFIFHACFAIYADTHSAYFHSTRCTRLLLTVFPPSIIPLYRYRFIVPTVFLPRRLS